MMKPGDLIKRIDSDSDALTHFLSGGDKKCWDKFRRLIHSNVALEFSDVGIVLLTSKLVPGINEKPYIKILTAKGTGWIYESYISIVQSSVGG